jgi:hypothetical protein
MASLRSSCGSEKRMKEERKEEKSKELNFGEFDE